MLNALARLDELIGLLKNGDDRSPFGRRATEGNASVSAWELLQKLSRKSARPSTGRDWVGEIESLVAQIRSLERAAPCPIVAITGLLNAGKSSLLAGFLSDAGRARVLIGSANSQGTHRFVLWLPSSWRANTELWQTVREQLILVFGHEPEPLSDKTEEAFEQYNGRVLTPGFDPNFESARIPLLTVDDKLDELGIGLMDCPDIQTGMSWLSNGTSSDQLRRDNFAERSMGVAEHRAMLMSRASHLCSAFLCVAAANALRDQKFVELVELLAVRMPNVPRYIVVNRVPRRYPTSDIANEVTSGFTSIGFERAYLAYNFHGPWDRERLPSVPIGETASQWEALPIFFQILPPPTPQPPEEVPSERYLVHLGRSLDAGRLATACRESLNLQLASLLNEAVDTIFRNQLNTQQWIQRIQETIVLAVLDVSQGASNGKPGEAFRMHLSREIVRQFSDSLDRTAPWWAKPSRLMVTWIRSAKESVDSLLMLKKLGDKASSVVENIRERFRQGEMGEVMRGSDLANRLRSFDYRGDLLGNSDDHRIAEFEVRCQQIIQRFQQESRARLDDVQLDQFTNQIWTKMPWKKRLWIGFMPTTLVFAPLVAVILLPFDFGGSSVLVLASAKELLLAGVAGLGLVWLGGDQLPNLAEHEVAVQQIADMVAIACDELGLPRIETKTLSNLVKPYVQGTILESTVDPQLKPGLSENRDVVQIDPNFRRNFDHHLQQWLGEATSI